MNAVCIRDIVRATIGRPDRCGTLRRVGNGENTLEAREDSMQSQLAGTSAAVTAEEAAAGLAAAEQELAHGRGVGYGVGFGYVKNFGSTRGLDGIRLEYALTDGERVANVHATISGTRLALLGYDRTVEEPDERLRGLALKALYDLAGSISRDDDRYATLLTQHPLQLSA
jgi:hypothetical protein